MSKFLASEGGTPPPHPPPSRENPAYVNEFSDKQIYGLASLRIEFLVSSDYVFHSEIYIFYTAFWLSHS